MTRDHAPSADGPAGDPTGPSGPDTGQDLSLLDLEDLPPGALARPGAGVVADLAQLALIDAGGRADSLAANTRRAYASRWARFEDWCVTNRLCPVPAEAATVRAYVAQLRAGGLGMATITQTLAAIWAHHADAGIDAPARIDVGLRQALAGYARQDAARPLAQRTALLASQTRHLLTVMDTTLETALTGTEDLRVRRRHRLLDVRDRAVILTGLATALRRAELVALQVSDLEADEHGLVITPARTKTDPTGTRRTPRPVPRGSDPNLSPVTALRRWLRLAAITDGPIFRPVLRWGTVPERALTGQSIRAIVITRAEQAELPGDWGAHSLRAGFATQAARAGASRTAIMTDGGWSSAAVDRYIRRGTLFEDAAASRIFT